MMPQLTVATSDQDPSSEGSHTELQRTRRERDLNQESFDRLLSWLGPNREASGTKYEDIRRRLIRLFTCRGCSIPEDLADDTINRVSEAIQKPDFQFVGDPILFFYGVARNVFRESLRVRSPLREPPSLGLPEESERRFQCLDRCMSQIPPRSRDLVLLYYQEDKHAKIDHRKRLAEKLGIGLNALRIQAHRVRQVLRTCMFECVKANSMK
jgi:DNA-directed RNA polymerase specialized sigma24 family protein